MGGSSLTEMMPAGAGHDGHVREGGHDHRAGVDHDVADVKARPEHQSDGRKGDRPSTWEPGELEQFDLSWAN